jgi:hypothetical protein
MGTGDGDGDGVTGTVTGTGTGSLWGPDVDPSPRTNPSPPPPPSLPLLSPLPTHATHQRHTRRTSVSTGASKRVPPPPLQTIHHSPLIPLGRRPDPARTRRSFRRSQATHQCRETPWHHHKTKPGHENAPARATPWQPHPGGRERCRAHQHCANKHSLARPQPREVRSLRVHKLSDVVTDDGVYLTAVEPW